MIIIIDTREQLPLSFTGHETISRKLDEGDYNTIELEDKIVIERKSVPDFYNSITNDHARFKREILRARDKKKPMFIFIEGTIKDVFDYTVERKYNPLTIEKIINTMIKRYELTIIECKTREIMSEKIMELMEKWIQAKQQKENI